MLDGNEVLDRYYPEVRAWMIQIAAVMDRYERAVDKEGGDAGDDERWEMLQDSVDVLREGVAAGSGADRAARIQMIFSDQTTEPIDTSG